MTQPIGTYLIGGGAIGPAIQVIDMSPDSAYEGGFGRIPPQGVPQADGLSTVKGLVWSLGLPTSGSCHGGSGVAGDGDSRLRLPEHSSAIYCD